ncbi:hypothetical protein TWF281_000668 [Arthrobotrys megalospora]
MNGLGLAPSSSSSTAAPTSTPATPSLISNNIANSAVVANSPFQSAPPVKQPPSSVAHSHSNNNNTRIDPSSSSSLSPSINGALPIHPQHDTTSIIGKRKRADSSPVKESQNVTAIPPAQKQQLLADFRRMILTSLAQHDAGISLLDKPVSPEPGSHEAKKSKTSPSPDGLQTLRQRLMSDSFYRSLNTLSQDVNQVTNEALEALGLPTDIAPEDEMKDDDVQIKNEGGDTPGKIKNFKQVAQTLIAQALSQHPYLNVPDDTKSPDPTIPDDISLDQINASPNYQLAVLVRSGNKSYYQTVKQSGNKSKGRKQSQDEMDVDDEPGMLQQSDLPPQAEIIRSYQNPTRESVRTLKEALPSFAKIPTGRRDRKSSERKSLDRRLEAPDWLYYGPFMSFAPTHDQGRATMPVHLKNSHWFALHGEKELKKIRAGDQHDELDEEAEFKELSEKYEPIPIDPALFEDESENDKALRGISDVLSELRLKQDTRLTKHSNPNAPSKPDRLEAELHNKSLHQLAELVGKLEPGVFKALEKFLDSIPSSDDISVKIFPVQGTLPDTAKVPPPAVPQPASQYTTTRVSYHQGEGVFSPSARVVSSRSQGHNQYTNRTGSFSQQSYPQTPINRQAYGPNSGYYAQQAPYTQPRPPIPVTPQQYAASGYTSSPFSRNATATVPRMSSSGAHPGFVQQSNPSTPFQATIRQTSFITQGTGHGPAQVQTGRRVSLAPQQPQPQVRPASGQGQAYAAYTPSHNQHTFTAHQTQQQILRVQQQQGQPQPQQFPHTPGQQQFAYNQQVRQMQPGQQRAPYPNGGYPQTPQVRVVQTQPGQPVTPR